MIPLNEQAYEHIKKLITGQHLSPEEIYSETKLSKELGISRTPLRDAIHRLVQEGYIDIIPSKGFRLHKLTIKDVEDTFQVRSALECYCTTEISKQASGRKAKKLFRELDSIMDQLKEIRDTSHSIEEFCEYDSKFHLLIIAYFENEQFSSIFGTYMYRMQRLAALSLAHDGRMEETCLQHQAILDCMKNGDSEKMYEITLRHMNTAKMMNLKDL